MATSYRFQRHIKTSISQLSIYRRAMALPCPLLAAICLLLLNLPTSSASPPSDVTAKRNAQAQVQSSKWKPEDGWNGLIPGKDKLPRAIELLGKPSKINNQDATYTFKNGLIEISMGDHDGNKNIIGRIVVQSEYPGAPKTAKEVCKLYDPLDGSTRTKPDGFEYKRCGLSIYMHGSNDRKVTSLDFHDPKLDPDLKF